jgi:hypothetical protein
VSQYRRLKASKGLASAGLMFFTLTISVKSHHKKIVRIYFEAVGKEEDNFVTKITSGREQKP